MRLGAYEVTSQIGVGGMGEVYLAHDSKLGRDVAVKILPDLFARDPERLSRFEREARLLAALSHPNILAIHDFGVADGTAYAVTELLHGETLWQTLQLGAMPERRAIDVAVAIASALSAAQEKGIVHRDVKPENVFITVDGHVKLLDFGLARLAAPFRPDDGDRTVAHTPTLEGTVLGTVGYMSPEQVRGLEADHRSDLFSLGAVIYEMIAGRRAFAAATAVETMTAILNADPPTFSALGLPVPQALQRVIERCLEKRPERRFQSASDLGFALQQASGSTSSLETARIERRSAGVPRVWQTAVVVALLAAAFVSGRWLAQRADPPTSWSFHRLTFRPGNVLGARFSPDGRTVVYSASWQAAATEVFTVRTDGGGSRSLDVHDANVAAVSGTGELAILKSPSHTSSFGTLARLPLGGGAPRDVLQDVSRADWGLQPDDLAVVRRASNGFQRLEYPIGHVLYESPSISSMRISPDGRHVAFISERELFVAASVTGAIALRHTWGATGRASAVAWSPSGSELFVTAGPAEAEQALRAIDLSGRERVVLASAGGRLDLHDVSKDGDLLVERAVPRGGILFRGPADGQERDLSWLDGSDVRRLSRDGSLILFSESLQGASGLGDVFLRRTDGSPPIRLGDGRPLDLSADGKWVLAHTAQRPSRLMLLPTGAGSPRVLDTGRYEPNGGSFLPDGRIAFGTIATRGRIEFHVIDQQTGVVGPLTIEGRGDDSAFVVDRGSVFGPDGSVARVLPDGHVEILQPGRGARRVVPGPALADGDDLVEWLGDDQLYIARGMTVPMEVYRIDARTGVRRTWRTLMPADPTGLIGIRNVVIANNGESYAYSYRRVTSSDLYLVKSSASVK
jgi:eukaryotic-like serine/threonine-protein kinase